MQAMMTVLRHLGATGSLDGVADLLMDFAERQSLVAKPHYDELERRYAD